MTPARLALPFALGASLTCAAGLAEATAQIGGVLSLDSGSASCIGVHRLVPLTTRQDSFNLADSLSCVGVTSSVSLHGDAATASIGLQASTHGDARPVSGSVGLVDQWTIAVPASMAQHSTFVLPVSFHLEGDVAPGSATSLHRGFVEYHAAFSQFGSSNAFQVNDHVDTLGHFDQTFAGTVAFTYFGPTVPTVALFEAQLTIPQLDAGGVDFFHTLSAHVDLPAGFTLTTSSGLALFPPAVPEPGTWMLMAAGLVGLALGRRLVRSEGRSTARRSVSSQVGIA